MKDVTAAIIIEKDSILIARRGRTEDLAGKRDNRGRSNFGTFSWVTE